MGYASDTFFCRCSWSTVQEEGTDSQKGDDDDDDDDKEHSVLFSSVLWTLSHLSQSNGASEAAVTEVEQTYSVTGRRPLSPLPGLPENTEEQRVPGKSLGLFMKYLSSQCRDARKVTRKVNRIKQGQKLSRGSTIVQHSTFYSHINSIHCCVKSFRCWGHTVWFQTLVISIWHEQSSNSFISCTVNVSLCYKRNIWQNCHYMGPRFKMSSSYSIPGLRCHLL